MILTLADDLSGAAELAEIAASKGLRAQVATKIPECVSVDFLAIDTQTRPNSPATAALKTKNIIEQLKRFHPTWFYKKTDSALRGNIFQETEAMATALGKDHVLFIPANPALGRCIRDGHYWVGDLPLNQSIFGQDPQNPIQSSEVSQELGIPPEAILQTSTADENERRQAWTIPDISSEADIATHAKGVSPQTLPAGAGAFFRALLTEKLPTSTPPSNTPTKVELPLLWLCGSAAAWQLGAKSLASQNDFHIYSLQEKDCWVKKVCTSLRGRKGTMMAIGSPEHGSHTSRQSLAEVYLDALIDSASAVIESAAPRDILIEGGATASALFKRMKWKQFESIPCYLSGLACLRPINTPCENRLFVKPGSYPWPETLWNHSSLSGGT